MLLALVVALLMIQTHNKHPHAPSSRCTPWSLSDAEGTAQGAISSTGQLPALTFMLPMLMLIRSNALPPPPPPPCVASSPPPLRAASRGPTLSPACGCECGCWKG
jgi:hypothetical protein